MPPWSKTLQARHGHARRSSHARRRQTTRRAPPIVLTTLTLAFAGACSLTPAPLQGEFAALTPRQAQAGHAIGATVRWGGEIIATHPKPMRTCVEVLAAPLDASTRPRAGTGDTDRTRFLACKGSFLDPAIYGPGRELTVTGVIEALESRSIGEYKYLHPVVNADAVHLWEEAREPILPPPPLWPAPYNLYWPENHRNYIINKK